MTIKVDIIADSISEAGKRITTFQLSYPLMIHAELMTHRVFSRNAASNRAIPVTRLINRTIEDPAIPMVWGSNKPGMSAGAELGLYKQFLLKGLWLGGLYSSAFFAYLSSKLGLHKQHANRMMMPYQHIDVIVTSTEWENFYNLRLDEAAQPEIQELAKKMLQASERSIPKVLKEGEWHLPYVASVSPSMRDVSAARCARVSYLNHNNQRPSEEADIKLSSMLLSSRHMSPFEHQASPMENVEGQSNNFKGWFQYREEIEYPFFKTIREPEDTENK